MILDWLFKGAVNIGTDFRQRVVEEGWFSRIVTPRTQNITLGTAERAAGEKSLAEQFGWLTDAQRPSRAPDLAAQEPSTHERGIDR